MSAKILVVDDEPHLEIVILQAFQKEVQNRELSFLFAHDGEEALSILKREPDIDIALSDINMPGMDGITLLKNLNENYPLLRTVIVTAYGDMTNIRLAMNHGAFDFLNKPINFGDLKITIEKTLGNVRQLKELHRESQQRYLAEKLRSLTETLTSTLDMTEVLDRFLNNLSEMVTFRHAIVCLEKQESLSMVASHGGGPIRKGPAVDELMDQLFTDVKDQERPIMIDSPEIVAKIGSGNPNAALLCLPLISKQGIPGMVILDRGKAGGFQEHEKNVAFSLCGHAAMAIENARLFQEVHRGATTDGLTGLNNRRHFLERSEDEVTRSRRYGNPLTVIMLDIDHFKRFNDSYGHAVGDEVLRTVADTLLRECRQTDLLGRFGGDEMVLLLIETDQEMGREIAERLRSTIETQGFPIKKDREIPITVSIGMATLDDENNTLQKLLHRADQRLYSAKEKGRNRIVFQ